ncbi:MbcA/ParS/Xre antitoxin family protein [Alteromonas sp. CNT1-28]|jgi:hypothetical protein|uniref:MbcA/ParS/Xre antitoxin family protein n=1 Tax=Alteromonas sp. CNT1-28 TaxID=2917730 RepID=UPI001EF2CF3D|nr:MbcA/ParS/Xre antitoxin family protein [Alteromonas sp. CNT1-28]MCG7639702.1 MbcA/ParS/Xre antitoxin family protein [Alteromonas sp. CNT1-28]
MSPLEQSKLAEKSAQVAISTFFNIMNAWQVKVEDQVVLLGKPSKSEFYNWKNGHVSSLPNDTLERISYILGIYKALRTLFPTLEQASAWPLKPNKDFSNRSALEVMLEGGVTHLSDVRRYLDAQQG